MGKRLYCGNLSYSATADEVKELFAAGGRTVVDVHIVQDRETGRSRGFAFVELSTDEEAEAAISEINGKMHQGRPLMVKEAMERSPRPAYGGPRPPMRDRPSRPMGGPGGDRSQAPRFDRGAPYQMEPPPPPPQPVDYAPPADDGDYRDRGDRGKRGRDRRGGKRRTPDFEGW